MIEENAKSGFTYRVEVVKDGVVVDAEAVHNLMPVEGLNYLLNAGVKGQAQSSSWYLGAFKNNYTPVAADVMATFAGLAGESTAYESATRPAVVLGAVANGAVDNSASKVEFTFTATETIYGGFVASSSTKGGTAGTLLSAVKFATPKAVEADAILRITAGLTLTSA